MTMVACQFKIDETEKIQAFEVIESYGLSPSQVLRSFLKEIGQTKRIPLDLSYQAEQNYQPNAETAAFLLSLKQGLEPKHQADSIDDLMEQLYAKD
ncbi:type II toxin-antitoxin system RelB/DinJ family antitoxin [Moraxella sp. ZY210820]|uniref:type II toxin-antitoxin system RelB/DinJ family antitoxin n=1 Tax=unclassified Moraxella TaxID=2685852 RepID=UPI00273217AF|nr:type II toxin-antitoxin system RelB/DinJ family antitoxin [Moraxella sp. ZY210820]WLF84624.1 type II toxin-antitoxin system RelB/DinJ family antitoxin [Moraxella sp. ZY210820]